MKKIIVCGALFNLICIQVHAVQTPGTISEKKSSAKSYITTKKPQSIEINCDYRISAETQKIDKTLVVSWAKYAVLHSFDFNFLSFDSQLKNLKVCYTQNGWISFMNALKDSGNINSIKTQNLMVSSILDGEVQFIEDQENQWKMNVPIKVFYKNDKEEETHFLNVYITISWRNAFKLGIAQIIATPRFPPLSQKTITIREAIKSASLSVTHQINNMENLKKLTTSFLTSLFVITPRSSLVPSHPELCLKLDHENTHPLQQLIEGQKYQSLDTPILTSDDHKNPVESVGIEKYFNADEFEWTKNQFLAFQSDILVTKLPKLLSYFKEKGTIGFNSALHNLDTIKEQSKKQFLDIKSDILATKLPKLLTYFKEKGTIGFNSALHNLDKTKAIKNQNPNSQHRNIESQLIENKNNQWNVTLPMQVIYQNDKNQITQLVNVNLTIGRKADGELAILQMNAIPRASSSSSKSEISQSTQVPKIIFNTSPEQPKRPELINCDYKTPDAMTKIDENLVIKWAEQAATQSFNFNSVSVETQLQKLESCYTAKGWESFKNALDKSGNIAAIKSQKLIMSSKVIGQAKLTATTNNQWSIALPLQVVYQNNQVKITQFLKVHLTMERTLTGEFGITQIIASLNNSDNTNTAATNLFNQRIDSVQKTQQSNSVHNQLPVTQSTEQALQNTQQSTVEQQKESRPYHNLDYKIPI
ncbi:DotI/IcmL family type IV secretion protein [Legionella tucsonensis]|uniref:IcmL-like protein n=1 Tax=Legionella tucsonensis TaxID=40335 RepID=A0A0W0ZUZ0_9GAMM|nr:DotI/IcmL family type IV secretion protein [Legionella tucsonensis]KTD72846.1 IcmL-like protein [Legionella tucsonensis]